MPDELTPTPEEATADGGETPTEVALPGSSPAIEFSADKPDAIIGRYKLLKELGRGGFGSVWQAEQTEPIRREVALKIIKPGMDSREIIARFEAERQTLALMDHPNIAAVLDAGTTDRGLPYFVMELVKGPSITDYADEHKLTIRQRLELFIPVCQAVQHAHQKAILHRDLKPSNILVTEVDGKPMPKVIDFGIAKALGASPEEMLGASLALTQAGMIVGTPQYMSPEQAGSVPDVDTRSDIYTLGVILYELLTGQTPLSREQLRQAALNEILRLVREAEPQRPSSRFIPATDMTRTTAHLRQAESKKLGHALRGDLDWIVLKALEKDRARRYETANAFARDLQRHLNDEPVSAGPPSAGYRLKKLVRRNRLAFAAASVVLGLLAAGIMVSTWQAVRATSAEKLAEGRRVQAEAAATQARENLSQSDFLQALRSIDEDRSRDALAQLTRSLALNPRNEAALCRLTTLLLYHSFAFPIMRVTHDGEVRSARFSPDGKRIVTASEDNTVRVWDAESGKPVTEPMQHNGGVWLAEFSPDGKRVVTVSRDSATPDAPREKDMDSMVRIWDAQSGQPLTGPLKPDPQVDSAEFSPDGKQIVTGSVNGMVRILDAQSGQPVVGPLETGDKWVMAVHFSPDGRKIVTASGYDARVWDAQSGQPLTEPMKHNSWIHSAQFSPDGKWIVTATDEENEGGSARVWDAQSGQPLTEPMKHNGPVHSARFSPDGKRIATTFGRAARIWDAQTAQPLTEPMQHGGEVWDARFSPDGKRMVTASLGGRGRWAFRDTRIWDAQSGKPLTEPMIHQGDVSSAQFSPDGRWIVTASFDHTARVWNVGNGKPWIELMKHEGQIASAKFTSDGKRVLTTSRLANNAAAVSIARVWDTERGTMLAEPAKGALKLDAKVVSVRFSPDEKRIATTSGSGIVRIWDAQSGQALGAPIKLDANWAISTEFSPDGKRIATTSEGTTVRIWDAQSGLPLTEPMKHVWSVHFSPDGRRIVTTSGKTARVWDAQNGQPLTEPMKDDEGVGSAHFSPDGKRIVTSGGDTARVWDAQSGQPVTKPLEHDDRVDSAEFSPDGKRIVTVEVDGTMRVWDAQGGLQLSEAFDGGNSAQFSPDGKWIVTASGDDAARVWDAQSGQQLTAPMQHGNRVESARFSPDGKRIVTASKDGTARVWDVQSGHPLTDPLEHGDSIFSAEFSPDGRRIVTAALDGAARIWELVPRGEAPEWLPRLAEAVAGQHLNDRGVFEALNKEPGQVLEQIRTQLNRAADDDEWTIWGRWFLADRSKRTISPFSKITVPEYIENRIKENTPASLDEAELLAAGNAEFLQRIAQARETPAKQVPPLDWKEERPAASAKDPLKMQEEALALHRKENGPEAPETLTAMNNLANAYSNAGRMDEALPLWMEASVHLPKNTQLALKIAALQVWFGKDADYAATSRRMLELATGTDDASIAERAAKAYCLRPSFDPQLIESAVALARRAVNLGKGHQFLEWYQMALGMAEYRRGNYPGADQALGAAEKHEKGDPLLQDTARFFHVMSLFRQGKQSEARELFDKAVSQMKPLPADETQPLANGADADSVIVWLAYKEAKALLKPNAHSVPAKP